MSIAVNHLIIGARDLKKSVEFYTEIFGYRKDSSFLDTGTGREGTALVRAGSPALLLVPFLPERLPNPQHLALEVDEIFFEEVLRKCTEQAVATRSLPALTAPTGGPARHEELGRRYKHFYFCDPAGVNIEVMKGE